MKEHILDEARSLCQKCAGDLSCTTPWDTDNLGGQGHTKVALKTKTRVLYLIC